MERRRAQLIPPEAVVAIAVLVALVALTPEAPPAPARVPRPSVTTATPDTVTDALAAEELALRRDVDARLRAGQRAPTGADPRFLATGPNGEIFVVGPEARTLVVDGDRLRVVDDMPGATPSPRLLAWLADSGSDGNDDDDSNDGPFAATVIVPRSGGGVDLVSLDRVARRVLVTRAGGPSLTIPFEGALTSLHAFSRGADLVIMVVGVEDAPLDRSLGTFGTLDPFVFRVDVDGDGVVRRAASRNLGDDGIVTPKAIARLNDGHLAIAGAGSGTIGIVDVDLQTIEVLEGLVGANDIVAVDDTIALASPLADAVALVDRRTGARRVIPVVDPARPPAPALVRLGEALVFSTALAPEQASEGLSSRFTCEACHDDGRTDGRRHGSGRFTGDDEVMVTTKPLRGLFQNAPLFSRAFDSSVAAMVHAEVRVANAGTPRDAWTPIVVGLDAPFLRDVVGRAFGDVIDPVTQRRAMLHFFAGFDPMPVSAQTMSPTSADWRVFERRCTGCHAPRLFSDDATSTVAFDRWPDLARSRSLVWASERRVDVGVRPLVREGGARVSSLRAVAEKGPLLTNGAARDIEHLVAKLRVDGDLMWHDGPASRGTPLPDDERDALRRVLEGL